MTDLICGLVVDSEQTGVFSDHGSLCQRRFETLLDDCLVLLALYTIIVAMVTVMVMVGTVQHDCDRSLRQVTPWTFLK